MSAYTEMCSQCYDRNYSQEWINWILIGSERYLCILMEQTNKFSLVMTDLADVDGLTIFIQLCVWPCFPPLFFCRKTYRPWEDNHTDLKSVWFIGQQYLFIDKQSKYKKTITSRGGSRTSMDLEKYRSRVWDASKILLHPCRSTTGINHLYKM